MLGREILEDRRITPSPGPQFPISAKSLYELTAMTGCKHSGSIFLRECLCTNDRSILPIHSVLSQLDVVHLNTPIGPQLGVEEIIPSGKISRKKLHSTKMHRSISRFWKPRHHFCSKNGSFRQLLKLRTQKGRPTIISTS